MTQQADSSAAVPDAVLNKIKQAWVAGIISTALTAVMVVLAMSGAQVAGFTAWEAIDVALMAGLTYGIYRKSRICAVLMFVYFVASKIMMAMDGSASGGFVMAAIFAWFYGQGMVGTFAYHKHLKRNEAAVGA
jgi:hypothetical protein